MHEVHGLKLKDIFAKGQCVHVCVCVFIDSRNSKQTNDVRTHGEVWFVVKQHLREVAGDKCQTKQK